MIKYTNNYFAKIKVKPPKRNKKKTKENIYNSGVVLPRTTFENPLNTPTSPRKRTYVRNFAKQNFKNPTAAEKEFYSFLQNVNGGVLRGKFTQQHVFSNKWILDFFFHEIRLGIEIDGGIHNTPDQKKKDKQKDNDSRNYAITLVRFTNAEVFGDKELLLRKLRESWKLALENRQNFSLDYKLGRSQRKTKVKTVSLILLVCNSCGHSSKQYRPKYYLTKNFKCSKCDGTGHASSLD